jgi:hypothetical protein
MATRAVSRQAALTAERRFFTGMALVVLLSTFLGFAPTYYLRFAMTPPHPVEPLVPYVFVHGLLYSAWVLLFVAQTGLVAAGRTDLHRRLGIAGIWLIAIMIPVGLMVALGGVARPLTAAPGISPLSWLAIPLLDLPVFSGLIVTALIKRRVPATHKRLMLIAMIDMIRPSLGRLLPMLGAPGPVPLLAPLLFLLPLIVWDWRMRGRVHPATLWGSLLVAGVTILTLAIWMTPAWLAFAGWITAPLR